MRKICLCVLFLLIVTTCFAGEVVLVPQNVKEIKYAEISTGGGKTAILYIKVLCELEDGRTVLYITKKITTSSIFGFSRWALPEKIEFKKSNKVKDKIEWR